jgi:hypothetical protein
MDDGAQLRSLGYVPSSCWGATTFPRVDRIIKLKKGFAEAPNTGKLRKNRRKNKQNLQLNYLLSLLSSFALSRNLD